METSRFCFGGKEMNLRELVWKVKGKTIELKDIQEVFDVEGIGKPCEKLFFKSRILDLFKEHVYNESVWFHKYNMEQFNETELEALEECLDYSEIDEEINLLQKRIDYLKQTKITMGNI